MQYYNFTRSAQLTAMGLERPLDDFTNGQCTTQGKEYDEEQTWTYVWYFDGTYRRTRRLQMQTSASVSGRVCLGITISTL